MPDAGVKIEVAPDNQQPEKLLEDTLLSPGNIYAATKACENMVGSIYAKAYGRCALYFGERRMSWGQRSKMHTVSVWKSTSTGHDITR